MADGASNQTHQEALLEKFAYAIACAEGFFKQGSLPCRTHNPGDMKLGDVGFGLEQEKTVFKKADPSADIHDHTDGFAALKRELMLVLTNRSHVYTPKFTLEEFATKWTGGDAPEAWATIVAQKLGIETTTTIAEYFGMKFEELGPTEV